jgi:hypothetical protein
MLMMKALRRLQTAKETIYRKPKWAGNGSNSMQTEISICSSPETVSKGRSYGQKHRSIGDIHIAGSLTTEDWKTFRQTLMSGGGFR